MVIRDAVLGDAHAVAKVYLDSVLAAYAEIATEEYLSSRNLADCIKQWTYNIRDDSVTVVVAEDDGVIKGVASFGPARDKDVDATMTAELQAIYVAPESWAHGIGHDLCEHVMSRLYCNGFAAVLLWVLSDNSRAIRFYERAGFMPDGTSKTATMGHELSATRYRHMPINAT